MPYHVQPGVIGCAIEPSITDLRRSLEEIIYDVGQQALADAKLSIEDIDGIVVAANDQYDGRAISIMAASGSVGGVDRDILSTPSASEHAFVLGALRVATGQFRTQLVVAWSPTEAHSLAEVQRLGADPYFHRRLPLDELSAHALQANAIAHATPEADALALSVLEKNRKHGAQAYPDLCPGPVDRKAVLGSKPIRWPLREQMVAPPTTGAVAMVLAGAAFIAERKSETPAWVRGMGWATEPSFLGDRDLSDAPALRSAASQAYGEVGIAAPEGSIHLAEVADATPYQELLAYDALGFCKRAEWGSRVADGSFARGGRLPVNLSGGSLTLNPVYCTGLVRIAQVANQVRGRAGRHQHPNAQSGLAHAASGFAMQYQTVAVMSRAPAGALS